LSQDGLSSSTPGWKKWSCWQDVISNDSVNSG